jgi:hypothetical protein
MLALALTVLVVPSGATPGKITPPVADSFRSSCTKSLTGFLVHYYGKKSYIPVA